MDTRLVRYDEQAALAWQIWMGMSEYTVGMPNFTIF